MIGQTVKRKKKGRPQKSVHRASRGAPVEQDRDVRRSLRRRNVKYIFDLDDYFDFDFDDLFEDDDEDQRRRKKKLDLLLNLQNGAEVHTTDSRRVDHTPVSSATSSDGEGGKPSKRRKIDDEDDEVNEEEEARERKPESNAYEDSPPETRCQALSDVSLPDKKALELILDKLQKKDIYGVYSEPVDPEELPDYHEVIKRPMDFATVRNKLRNGSYVALEQFENDVFLICSNAMQYNSPDTIYHKQACSIQELAKRKFDKIRLKVSYSEKEIKSEHKISSTSSILKKQIKRSVSSRTVQEPVASDFSSGAALATPVDDIQNAFLSVGYERTGNIEGHVEGNYVFNDNNVDRGEESLPGKGPPLSIFGRKPFTYHENRRLTYSISLALPVASSESIFSTFDEESKQLVPVGLYSDHAYGRSLARFAASLGSVAWRVASNRIEQALPQGFKFGRGWVGEYEPLPTPVLILENCIVKEPAFFTKPQTAVDPGKFQNNPMVSNSSTESPGSEFFLHKNLPFPDPAKNGPLSTPIYTTSHPVIRGNVSEVKPVLFSSPNLNYQHQNSQSGISTESDKHQNSQAGISTESDKKVLRQVELNRPPSFSKTAVNPIFHSQLPKSSEIEPSSFTDFTSRNLNFSPSGSFKHPESNGNSGRGMPNEKATLDNRLDSKIVATSSHDLAKNAVNYYPREQGQGLTDPVCLMRMLSEKAQNQQKSSDTRNFSSGLSSGPSDSNNAAVAAAHVWMSVGAGGGFRPPMENINMHSNQIFADSLYNSTRFSGNIPASGMQVQNGVPIHTFMTQSSSIPMAMRVGSETHFQNQQIVFPQMLTTDLSRFQVPPSNWRNLSPQIMHQRQKPESFPPDLNIGFQTSGSPGKPSSSVLVDSQQPDLALQL